MTTDTTRYRVQEGANEVGLGGRSLHIVRPVTGMRDILTNLDDISFGLLGERGRPWRNMQFSVS